MIEISTTEKQQVELKESVLELRYAWANQQMKTWFITKNKICEVPGSRLLFILYGQNTSRPVYAPNTYPQVGNVVKVMNGSNFLVTEINK